MKTFSETDIKDKMNKIPGWEYINGQITRDLILKDFQAVISLVNKTAEEAEKMNHHPDIFIYSWNKIRFTVSTHSENGITEKDFELAGKINSLAGIPGK